MKIAIDGFNLGFAQGTGIATYARELSKILAANNHEIYTCYGLNGVGQNSKVAWPRFVQNLTLQGESGRYDFAKWGCYGGRYLLKHLLRQPIQATVVPIDPKVDISAVVDRLPVAELLNIPSVFRVSQLYSLALNRPLEISFPSDKKVDIFHATCPLPIAMRDVANVVTFHDIIPLVLPQSTEVNLSHYQRILKLSIDNADMIFTVSEHSRHDLISYFDVPEDKVYVTYQAVDIPAHYRGLDDDVVSLFLERNFGLKRNEYFLFFGAVEPKKNIARIIEAMTIAKTDYPIVIVGKDGWLYDDVNRLLGQLHKRASGKRRFRRIEYVPFRQLAFLLKGACGLVFPSLYEGFGLPVLEAMLMKCPVITSNVSSLPEVGGDAVLYVNPLDVGEIAAAIDSLAYDRGLRSGLIERGLIQAEKFSPSNHLQRLEKGYQRAMG
ncbi:MAG: glycosyltransferase family 1 protein [Methylovulum sp.]|nr:glycosyltransferase family 1 protein [Methylovulum sp.]